MKEIPLTQGFVAIVDDEDYIELSGYKWYAWRAPNSDRIYAIRYTPRIHGKHYAVRMHRQIMGFPNGQVDHWDHNGLHNQRDNLRIATQSQNMANRRVNRNSSSGLKGVYWNRQIEKWRAMIQIDHTRIYLGDYSSKEIAARAYDMKAIEVFGEFATLNYPQEK